MLWYSIVMITALSTQLVKCVYEENKQIEIGKKFIEHIPLWGFKCDPLQGCQQVEKPSGPGLQNVSNVEPADFLHESVDLCRLVCGRFGAIWPRPVTAALSSHTIKINPNYLRPDLTNTSSEVRPLILSMFDLFMKNLDAECDGQVTEDVKTTVVVYITVSSPRLELDWTTDEQYLLDINSRKSEVSVHIAAQTVYGARHALETLSQLVASNKPEFSTQKQCSLHMISAAKIMDKPVYKHRGLVLDTSRNFMPMAVIKKTLDGMAASKMNVFHWHVTDSQSFPLESYRVPQFTKYGAYSESAVYKVEEVRDLMQYARVRGIRVVIEIDAPAHAGNGWQWGPEYDLGDLAVCVNEKIWRKYCVQPPCGQLNPANPAVYRVLKDLYKDIADLLPSSPLLHMGGDEVFINCWNSSVEIVDYMRSKGMMQTVEGFMQLWGEFQKKALKAWDEVTLTSKPQPVMIWTSELTKAFRIQNYLDKRRYIIQVWEPLDSPDLNELLKLGYRVVASPKDVWYLDRGFWGVTQYANWRRMYNHMLSTHPNVLGGEVAMWTEYVNSDNLDPRVWPRAAAVAERLWSDPTAIDNYTEARLQRHRNILTSRGLRPDAISPGWCALHASKCS